MAVVLAIAFSAFTIPQKKAQNTGTTYYWYEVVNDKIVSGPVNPTNKIDRDAALDLAPCENSTDDPCYFGSDDDALPTDESYDVSSHLGMDNAIFRE